MGQATTFLRTPERMMALISSMVLRALAPSVMGLSPSRQAATKLSGKLGDLASAQSISRQSGCG